MASLFQTVLRDLPPARPLTLGLWTAAANAARVLLEAGCGEALVLDGERPLGVVTTRGLARLLARHPDEAAHLAVRDVMDPVAVSSDRESLVAALRHLLAAPSRRLAVVDAMGRAVGILAPYHVVLAQSDRDELAGRTVAQAMARTVVTARADEDVSVVLGRMSRAAVGGVVVVDEADRPLGIFTSRDAVARLASGLETRSGRLAELMRTPVVSITPQLSLSEALAGMDGAGGGRLAVTDPEGLLLGVLTWTDVAKALCAVLTETEAGRSQGQAMLFQKRYDAAPQGLFRPDLVEAMPAPVFYKDIRGRFQGCNKAFESLLGLPREQLVDRQAQDVQASALAEKDRELLHRGGGHQVYETSLDTAVGLRHVLMRKSLFHDADGNAAGIIGIVLDITDRKQAEAAAVKVRDDLEAGLARHAGELREANSRLVAEVAERQRIEVMLRRNTLFLETVLNAIQDGICVLALDMTILKVNQAMYSMYSGTAPLEGRRCYEFYRGRDTPCENCPSLRVLATGKMAIGVVPKVEAGRDVGWVELYCYPLTGEDGAVTGVVEIVRDVTARKKLEAELADALERAEAGSQAKGAFLANMSHEIRTPLNAVLGYVQLMLHDHLEPSQRERLSVVEESAATLLSIINDILDYSKIEAGRLEIKAEPFDLVRCLEAAVKEQEVLARDKGLALRLVLDPNLPRMVRGDGLRLRQILRNLVNNAVKYTEKGQVTVSAGLQEPQPPEMAVVGRMLLRFAVADTGMGIPEAEQATVFDSFTQVEGGLTRRQAGTGLGLAICRRLAGLMGGMVSMKSRPGQGSEFWLTCPFELATSALPIRGRQLPAPENSLVSRLRFLLVEDNRINRVFATDLLGSRGHEVVTAENGRAALDYLACHPVDLVLMDIQMPVMDGLTATRSIRAGHLGIDPGVPVVGLSAYAMDQERERFLAAGLDDYITKPFAEEEFFAVVRRVLTRRGRPPVLTGARQAPAGNGTSLDTDRLACQYRNKTELFARVAREFLLSVPQQLDTLETAVGRGDVAVCERVAHTLKGNAAMFGAEAMREVAARAEDAAASGDMATVRRLAGELGQACRTVLVDLEAYLERLGH
jgi:PAS domain S-box-containing protein